MPSSSPSRVLPRARHPWMILAARSRSKLERVLRQVLAVEPVGVAVQRPEGLGGVFRELVDRDAVVLQVAHPGRDVDHPHEAAQNRLEGLARDARDRLGGAEDIGHRLRGQDHQRPVHPLVADDRAERVLVALRGGIADHVHGVVQVGRGGQVAGQRLHRLVLELGQLQPGEHGHVGGDDARAARVGHDRHAVARGHLAAHLAQLALVFVGEGGGEVEQLVDGIHPDDARLLEDGVVDPLGARQRAGVGGRGLGAGAGAPALDHQHRLGPVVPAGDLLDRLDELRPAAQLLDVEQDHLGVVVLVQVAQEIQLVHVGLVADGDELGEAEVAVGREVQDRRAQRAALRDEGDVAGPRHARGEAGVQAHVGQGVDHPQAVGADHAHPRLAADGHHAVLDGAALGADLAEARRDDDDALHPAGDRVLHRLQRRLGRQDHDAEIQRVGDVLDRGVGPHTRDRARRGVDRVQRPGEAALQDVDEDVVAHLAGGGRRTDHRHRLRAHDRIQRLQSREFHGVPFQVRQRAPRLESRLGARGHRILF